jgi:hypothetical protein
VSSMLRQGSSRRRGRREEDSGPDEPVVGEVILGVDPHKDLHAAAVLDAGGNAPGQP